MEISCPNCYATYPVNPEKIPDKGATPTCKKCGGAFTIVKATGDPVRDRAQRIKGYVLVRERNGKELYGEKERGSGAYSRKSVKARQGLSRKQMRLGAFLAGVLLLLCASAMLLWKHQVHREFEKALKSATIQASTKQYELNFEKVKFSWLGGLGRERGSIRGLSIRDHQSRDVMQLAGRVDFELIPSRKHFLTKPFALHADGRSAKTVFKGCVVESTEVGGTRVNFKADEIYSVWNGVELFTALRTEFTFRFNRDTRKESPGTGPEEWEIAFRAEEVQVWSEPIIKRAETLLSFKQGSFATLERCSLMMLGAPVNANGTLELHNPLAQSNASLSVSARNVSPIMKYIHRVNEEVFDRMVAVLVNLEEKNAGAYNQGTDSLELRVSYNPSGIKINGKDLNSLLLP